MRLSDRGEMYLKRIEGLAGTDGSPALIPYLDQAGIWTVGWGHILQDGDDTGGRWTPSECQVAFELDLAPAESAVNKNVKGLSQHQYDAFVILAFNIGVQAFRISTACKKASMGYLEEAADAILLWNKVTNPDTGQKMISRGLTRRREEERRIFLYADYNDGPR